MKANGTYLPWNVSLGPLGLRLWCRGALSMVQSHRENLQLFLLTGRILDVLFLSGMCVCVCGKNPFFAMTAHHAFFKMTMIQTCHRASFLMSERRSFVMATMKGEKKRGKGGRMGRRIMRAVFVATRESRCCRVRLWCGEDALVLVRIETKKDERTLENWGRVTCDD